MCDELKRHRPDIMVLGEGKALAVMEDDPMGVWCHIQDVRDILDEKDKEIADLIEKNKRLANKDMIMASETIKGVFDALRHQKYKRCLNKAEWCDTKGDWYYSLGESFRNRVDFYIKWRDKWLELAERFKDGV